MTNESGLQFTLDWDDVTSGDKLFYVPRNRLVIYLSDDLKDKSQFYGVFLGEENEPQQGFLKAFCRRP